MIGDWLRKRFHPTPEPIDECQPEAREIIKETKGNISRLVETREKLHQEIIRGEKADIARALISARNQVTH